MAIERRSGDISEAERLNLDALTASLEREDAEVPRAQRVIELISTFFGSPAYFVFAVIFIIGWVSINFIGARLGWAYVDEPPFFLLQGILSANALLLTIAVLIRQSRMAQLATHRAHLDLQINLLTEQKVTRLIQALGEDGAPRRAPTLAGSAGEVELATAADPQALLKAIKERAEPPPSI